MGILKPQHRQIKGDEAVILRTAADSDVSYLKEMKQWSAAHDGGLVAEPAELKLDAEAKQISNHAQNPYCIYLVAEKNDVIVGFLCFTNGAFNRMRHIGWFSMIVHSAWRGRGIGSLLVQGLLDWSVATPILEKVSLSVFSSNQRAVDLYARFGFQIDGVLSKQVKLGDGDYVDMILMSKFVRRP